MPRLFHSSSHTAARKCSNQRAQMMGATPQQLVDMLKGLVAMAEMGMIPMIQGMMGAQNMSGMGQATGGLPGMRQMPGQQPGMSQTMNMAYNYFTINGKAFPATPPWTVKQGDLVRVRVVNISNLVHPMHLHGQDFKVIAKDGEPAKDQWVGNTLFSWRRTAADGW